MRFMIVRARTLFCLILCICAVGIGIGCIGDVVPVFLVGERELPIYSVEREDNKLALSFNCAWNDSDIDTILNTLEEYGVRCTFFAVGTWAEKYPEALKKISDAGHEIGNHSYNHAHYSKMSREEILADMQKCDDVIAKLTGQKPELFRAAYGEYNNTVVSACEDSGRSYIQWSVDSLDYKAKSAEAITKRILGKTKPGDIVLLHNGTDFTAEALPVLLESLSAEYELCKVSELIYRENYTIDANGVQKKS